MAGNHERKAPRPLLIALALASIAIVYAPSAAARAATPPGEEAIVVLGGPAAASPEGRARQLLRALGDAGLQPVRVIEELGAVSVDLPPRTSVAAARRRLEAVEGATIEPNLVLELRASADDPAFTQPDPAAPAGDVYQWNLRKSGFGRAWRRSDGSRAKVAVIDTGVDARHPDLGPQVALAVDNDNTLLHGDANRDENGHGSHVAGLACGRAGDGFGIASAGFACPLLIFKSDLSIASISESIVEAADAGADVINMSFGGEGESRTLEAAIDNAAEHDVVMVAAAENEDTEQQGIPAEYLQPSGSGQRMDSGRGLVVTAAQYDGSRAPFLPGRGSGVSIAAYGSAGAGGRGIFSSLPDGTTEIETLGVCAGCRGEIGGDTRFGYLSGTSMATPQVAGAAALIRSKRPRMRAERVIYLLKRHARRDGGFSETLGWGVLNANRALKAALRKGKPRR